MTALSILRSGLLTTVQDLGRWGFQSRGVPVSGAMDWFSHRLANRIVGNLDRAATIEATLIGPHIRFEADATFVVTGAAFVLTLDLERVEMNRRTAAAAGSVLKFGERQRGARSFIAVGGGMDTPEVLGSRSTHVLTRMGGLDGRALRAGDRLVVMESGARGKGQGAITPHLTPYPSPLAPSLPAGGARLRVIPGDPHLFSHLASRRFRISPQSDRMGYRLEGSDPLTNIVRGSDPRPTGELISRAVVMGAIQVPPAGQPILLMADHPTSGGYAIGATVITADLPQAGQLAPGDWIEFDACSLEAADRALREREAALGGC